MLLFRTGLNLRQISRVLVDSAKANYRAGPAIAAEGWDTTNLGVAFCAGVLVPSRGPCWPMPLSGLRRAAAASEAPMGHSAFE